MKSICYHGFLEGPRSMGRVGKYFLDHLMSRDWCDVSFLPFNSDYMRNRWAPRYLQLIVGEKDDQQVDQQVTFCSVLDARKRRRAKIMSPWLFYEQATLPRAVAEAINVNDFAYVCSNFVRDTFDRSGVTIPLELLGHGFDPRHFHYVERQETVAFTFLCVAEHTPRKNLVTLVKAFQRAFQGRSDVSLVLKLGLHGEKDLATIVEEPGKIIFVREQLDEKHLFELYASAHCFVLPTRGEGFGMPILEAMATGMPVIVTNFSGHLDFCTPENAFLIDVGKMTRADASTFPFIAGAWAEPDEEHLIALMRHVTRHYDRALEVGRKAYADVKDDWTWQAQLGRAF